VTRTSLGRVNEEQPASLYEALFGHLYARCLAQASARVPLVELSRPCAGRDRSAA
jgi:hypothetical protein